MRDPYGPQPHVHEGSCAIKVSMRCSYPHPFAYIPPRRRARTIHTSATRCALGASRRAQVNDILMGVYSHVRQSVRRNHSTFAFDLHNIEYIFHSLPSSATYKALHVTQCDHTRCVTHALLCRLPCFQTRYAYIQNSSWPHPLFFFFDIYLRHQTYLCDDDCSQLRLRVPSPSCSHTRGEYV